MKKILKKVLDELQKESPRLDYIRGMLEVLIDEEPNLIPTPLPRLYNTKDNGLLAPVDVLPELVDPAQSANIEKIKKIAEQSRV